MISNFDVIVRHIEGNEDINIYCIADLHVGALEFLAGEWKHFKEQVLSEPNSYIIIAGDMMNNSTRSSVSNVFEELMPPRMQKRWLVEQLRPFAKQGRILCATDGNHERRSCRDADDDPLYDVMSKLDLEDIYRPDLAFLKLQVGDLKKDGLHNPVYTFAVTHGAGGSGSTGASVNKSEKAAAYFDGIDILVTAHTHKGHVTKPAKYVVNKYNNTVTRTHTVCIGCTSWLEWAGYAVRGLLPPADVADPQMLILSGNKKQVRTLW
jgi:predicted phosphodiesterase